MAKIGFPGGRLLASGGLTAMLALAGFDAESIRHIRPQSVVIGARKVKGKAAVKGKRHASLKARANKRK